MTNFQIALMGVGIFGLVLYIFAMSISYWYERKRHVH